ncbi:polyphosphate kinase 2 family protein [Corallococcus exiguus]|uniref:PPK2 family polyphosphate kinase n=1 Tax=Corallococcus TaxID=83461 RepID=UPI000EA28618|nr:MULTISPECIES: PPK2 family polyphosphate kinase [Corallococcus]NNC15309.1 polyphosphate kinase 2 family protein [Corallococcus exiguus]NRD55029.1 polyphosphate kinase 2 family protein [Corallococcus exiguus]NRD65544.1 polyphosphate kinase 2 family protein [Corallococcus exiguus]RKH28525.1 polyphosphate kinase 2 family protein [Corallococcus sp. CA041A]RKI11129.1 polyphosphate kinase 2 family protein [Corallococcus sp. AB030]
MDIIRNDKQGAKVKLERTPTGPPKKTDKEVAKTEFDVLGEELFDLQDLLWGAKMNSVLIVLQGRDTAGKDGTIKHVVGSLNPRGVSVTSFGVPSTEEREHDFLWRVHCKTPRLGEFSIFNRSHYEDVLVARVNNLVPKALWKSRYQHIRDFETLLWEHGTIILKFFLHISQEEQEQRLLAREEEPRKAWKIAAGDWEDRKHWADYTRAYEDVFALTSTEQAPWHLVPSDAKWYRNLVVARAVAEALRPYRETWQARLDEVGKQKKAELRAWRKKR